MFADDQYEGYYSYVRPMADLSLRHRSRGWTVEGTVRARSYQYREQTVSEDDSSRRRRAEISAEIRAERELLSWLSVFAEYAHEETFANRPFEAYAVNTVRCGLEATF